MPVRICFCNEAHTIIGISILSNMEKNRTRLGICKMASGIREFKGVD